MVTCPLCKAALEDGVRFCPFDGTPIALPAATSDPEPAERSERPTRALRPPAAEGEDPLLGALIDNRYRIRARLGEGGVGAVYEAEHIQIRRLVALKVLHPHYARSGELRARFEREALAASKVTHPGFVQVMDFGTWEGRLYLVMERVEGELLSERIERGPMAAADACAILCEILAAVGHAHAHGIVHRDLKPGNVMLCERSPSGGTVKVLDFGLAKNLSEASGDGLTRIGTVFGTPAYISPEQASARPVDARGDLYSVGVMLFEMICGRRPFVRESELELFQAHIQDPPPRARSIRPELSAEIDAVIARALEKDRERRFQTAAELAAAIAASPEARPAPDASRLSHAATMLALPASAPPAVTPAMEPERGEPAAPSHPTLSTGPVKTAAPPRPASRRWVLCGAGGAILLAAIATTALLVGRDARTDARDEAPDAARHASTRQTSGAAATRLDLAPAGARRGQDAAAGAAAGEASPDLQRAEAELAAGRFDSAVAYAREAVKQQRASARPYQVLGDAYYALMWYTDALEEYAKAIKRDAALRADPRIVRRAIHCLGRHGVWRRASAFLIAVVGAPAEPALAEVAVRHRDPVVRGRASYVLERIRGAPPR